MSAFSGYALDRRGMEASVGQSIRDDFMNFRQHSMPSVYDQLNSLEGSPMVGQALEDVETGKARSAQSNKMSTARFDLGMTPAQRKALARKRERDNASTNADVTNNARLDQKDRNENVALNLATAGNNLRGMGLNNQMQSIGLAGARDRGNAASSAQAKQSNIGTGMGLATLALMAF